MFGSAGHSGNSGELNSPIPGNETYEDCLTPLYNHISKSFLVKERIQETYNFE